MRLLIMSVVLEGRVGHLAPQEVPEVLAGLEAREGLVLAGLVALLDLAVQRVVQEGQEALVEQGGLVVLDPLVLVDRVVLLEVMVRRVVQVERVA